MYLPEARRKISQGDIFSKVSLPDSANPEAPKKEYTLVVLSHACDIDKPTQMVVLVCAARSFSELMPGQGGDIKKGRVRNAMYIKAAGGLEESFIDFRYTFRIHKDLLKQAVDNNLKIVSLTDKAQRALAQYFYRFLARDI